MTVDGLAISPDATASALEHARHEAPIEACGLFSGRVRDGVASAYHPARNALASPYRFDLHPADLVRIMFEIENAGDDLVGIFHSHVASTAVPSALDRREARYAVYHVLASLSESPSRLRAWRINGDACREVPLRVT